jgi:hypothetical protein
MIDTEISCGETRLLAPCADVLHPADEATAVANLASQVGAVRSVGNA